MLTFDRKPLLIITLLIIGMTVILTAEESPAVRSTLSDGIFLTFNFGDHLLAVHEKRDQLIDNGQLSWYRYPGFSYTQPNYWYIVNGIEEPFAVHMSYVDYQLSEIKLISSNNYENTEALRDIYVRKYGLDYNQEASGLGFSYTWLVEKLKVTISRRNKGRGDCVIHYSIHSLQMENTLDNLFGMETNYDEI
jgi:hypothetical protein